MGEERGAYRVLVGKSDGKRPLGRPRRRWAGIGLAQDTDRWQTLVIAVMNLWGSIKCGEFLD